MSNTSKVMPTYYSQMQVSFDYGKGAWLWDIHGNQYLDSLAGIAVCGLGHAHPMVTNTIISQGAKLLHTSNTYIIPEQIALAEKLTRVAEMDQAYFCNSGAETNEAAIKLARMYARKKNIAEPIIITMKDSFHGRSMATLSASGTERIRMGFEPLVKDFMYVELNNLAELNDVVSKHQSAIVAIMLEPIQGDGGIQIGTPDYLKLVRNLCDQYDFLMILDEVQTGMGRTGKWFAYQHMDIHPDVMTVAKALGNGIPIGACLTRGKANNLFGPGKHGTTLGGSPFASAVACTVIDAMEQEHVVDNAKRVGDYLLKQLKSVLSKHKCVVDVRGKGLMIGVELDRPCMELTAIGLKHKLLFNVTFNKVIRLLPPLIITENEADEIVRRLDASLMEYTMAG
jgi:acetylornithine/N-succinyldiaminopimelate aminotransferase